MANRAKSVCRHPACGKLLDLPGLCETHAQLARQRADANRGNAHQRGYGKRWQKARGTFLLRDPLCAHCSTPADPVRATEVDHIVPHKGDQALFWNTANWQSLCKPCHSRKTASEDGGFGRLGAVSPPRLDFGV